MGFFSWKTAAHNESDRISVASPAFLNMPTVYLLLPDGSHIKEDEYDGYGVFGGKDVYQLLGEHTARKAGLDPAQYQSEEIRNLGISIDVGDLKRDMETGQLWSVFSEHTQLMDALIPEVKHFPHSYADIIPEYEKSANDLVKEGRFVSVPFKTLIDPGFEVKLSFDPNAVYADLPVSENCPDQGFFYSDDQLGQLERLYAEIREKYSKPEAAVSATNRTQEPNM